MPLRLCICVLILLMITLMSLQHPIPVLNSEFSQTSNSDHILLQFKGTDGKHRLSRSKRQALEKEGTSESQIIDQVINKNIGGEDIEISKRKKHLEEEEEIFQRNQFYKPVSDDVKQEYNPSGGLKNKGGKSNLKTTSGLNRPAKIKIRNVKRQGKQALGAWDNVMVPHPNNAWVFRGGSKASEELNEKRKGYDFVPTLTSRKKRGNEQLDTSEMGRARRFCPETMETIRKINPLTIGDQVSQMIHDHKCNQKNKLISKSSFGSLHSEAQVEDPSNEALQENGDATRQRAGFGKDQPSTVMQKQCPSNDYGFSVIIIAGDPLKMSGSGVQNETKGKEEKGLRKKQKGYEGYHTENETRDKIENNCKNLNSFGENYLKKEIFVPKRPNINVKFPIYDQDLTFIPDPFNGLLDAGYWDNPENKDSEKSTSHTIRARSIHKKIGGKIIADNGEMSGNGGDKVGEMGNRDNIELRNVSGRGNGAENGNCVRNGNGVINRASNENGNNNGVRNKNDGRNVANDDNGASNGAINENNANNGVRNENDGNNGANNGNGAKNVVRNKNGDNNGERKLHGGIDDAKNDNSVNNGLKINGKDGINGANCRDGANNKDRSGNRANDGVINVNCGSNKDKKWNGVNNGDNNGNGVNNKDTIGNCASNGNKNENIDNNNAKNGTSPDSRTKNGNSANSGAINCNGNNNRAKNTNVANKIKNGKSTEMDPDAIDTTPLILDSSTMKRIDCTPPEKSAENVMSQSDSDNPPETTFRPETTLFRSAQSKSSVRWTVSTASAGETAATDSQSDDDAADDVESFGDLNINLNNTACHSYGVYYNNTDENNNNLNNNKTKVKLSH